MARIVYMPLYIGDYLADTQALTTEQHGAYLLLIMAMWTHGGRLPNDRRILAKIARVPHQRWPYMAGPVMAMFTESDGYLTHKRVSQELAKAGTLSKRQSEAAKAGYDAESSEAELSSVGGKVGPRPPPRSDLGTPLTSDKPLKNNDPPPARARDSIPYHIEKADAAPSALASTPFPDGEDSALPPREADAGALADASAAPLAPSDDKAKPPHVSPWEKNRDEYERLQKVRDEADAARLRPVADPYEAANASNDPTTRTAKFASPKVIDGEAVREATGPPLPDVIYMPPPTEPEEE